VRANYGLLARPAVGTVVRLTGVFLRNTGQIAGGEGQARWTVVACDCRACDDWTAAEAAPLVAVNEPHACQSDPRGYEDIAPEDRPKWRHIAACNLETVGARPRAADYPLQCHFTRITVSLYQKKSTEARGGLVPFWVQPTMTTLPTTPATETAPLALVATPSPRAWSAEQAAFFAAVETGTGHLVLKAPAGSGKTTTIMEAVARLANGEREILVVSFGREIKAEIAARVEKARFPGVYVSTLHSYGRRAVSRAFPRARCDEGKTTTIADRLFSDDKGYKYVRVLLAKAVSVAKNQLLATFGQIDTALDAAGIELAEYVDRTDFVRKVVTLVAASSAETATFDMDDMIWLPVVLGLACPTYDVTFIDETQDLNACQLELALRAAGDTGRIIAVGDERQAIYGFRGAGGKASIARIVDGLKANVLRMTVTYRCAKSIVAVAAETVDHFVAAPNAPEGEVITGDWMVGCRAQVKGGDLVVSRSNAPLIREVMAFVGAGKKACYLGRDAGRDLAKYAMKARAATIADLIDWAEEQCAKDCARCEKKGLDNRRVVDRLDTILALTEGAADVAEFFARIEMFFVAERGEDTIAFSTTHQAKGLEADRVFVFADTYSPGRSEEDDNLWYVAVTRAKTTLFLCHGTQAKREGGRW